MADDDELQREIEALLDAKGPFKSYVEIEADLLAKGLAVPPGVAMLADRERTKDVNN